MDWGRTSCQMMALNPTQRAVMYGDHCLGLSKTQVPWHVGFSMINTGCPGQNRALGYPSFQGLLE